MLSQLKIEQRNLHSNLWGRGKDFEFGPPKKRFTAGLRRPPTIAGWLFQKPRVNAKSPATFKQKTAINGHKKPIFKENFNKKSGSSGHFDFFWPQQKLLTRFIDDVPPKLNREEFSSLHLESPGWASRWRRQGVSAEQGEAPKHFRHREAPGFTRFHPGKISLTFQKAKKKRSRFFLGKPTKTERKKNNAACLWKVVSLSTWLNLLMCDGVCVCVCVCVCACV